MGKMRLFGTKVFGGYNKKDVDRYIARIEQEMESLEAEHKVLKENEQKDIPQADVYAAAIEEAIEEIENLRDENEKLKKEIQRIHPGNRKTGLETVSGLRGNIVEDM